MTQTAAVPAADAQFGSLAKIMDAAKTPEAQQRLLVKIAHYRADIGNAQRAFDDLAKNMKPAEAQGALQEALQNWIDQGDSPLRKAVAEGVFGAMANVGKPPMGEHSTPNAGKITGKGNGGVPRIGGTSGSVKTDKSRDQTTLGHGTVEPTERAEHQRGPEEDTILKPDSEEFDYEGVEGGSATIGKPGATDDDTEATRKKKARAKLAAGGGKIRIGQAFGGKVGAKEPAPKGGRAEKMTLGGELIKIAPDAMIDTLTKLNQADKIAMVSAAERYAADLMAYSDGLKGTGLSKRDVSSAVNDWMQPGDYLTKKWVAEALAGAGQIPLALGKMVVEWEGRPARRGPFA